MKAADSTGEVIRPRFDSEAADEGDQAKPQLIKRTLEVWQPRASNMLTHEDARQIAENVTGFFQILMEWDAAERRTPISPEVSTENPVFSTPKERTE